MTIKVYKLSETPVAVSYFPTGTPVEITLKDMTGQIIPISNNVCVESPAGSQIFTWSFDDIISKPTVGLRGYWEMVATDSSYPDSREQFQWGTSEDKEVVLGWFPVGKTVSISLWDIEGESLPLDANACVPLPNDLNIQSWSFDDLTTYPDDILRGYWEMKTDDDSYPDMMANFIINHPVEVEGGLEYRSIESTLLLKSEFCLYEDDFKTLKVRVKFPEVLPPDTDDYLPSQILSGKIIDYHGFEYILPWNEVITIDQTKVVKEIDLTTISFLSGAIPLNIGDHILEITYGVDVELIPFKVVPLTVSSIKNQYLLGVDLQSRTQLTIKQELRQITGVEITEISNDTTVGAKDLIWDATAKTLQWDGGLPVVISDDYVDYKIYDYTMISGLTGGDYISAYIEDIDDLPSTSITETVLVDVKEFSLEDFQYWINNAYQVVLQTIAHTDMEPTPYSSDKTLVENNKYKYLDPTQLVTKRFTRTKNFSFEVPINMLQKIIELWGHYAGEQRVTIDNDRIEIMTDGTVTVRGHVFGYGGHIHSAIGFAGMIDKTLNAENYPGSRNPTENFWQSTLTAGIIDQGIRDIFLQVVGKVAAIDLLLFAGLSKGQGIASRSFSVDGVSSAFTTTESAENSLFSGVLTDLQRGLGVGKATKEERETGLVNKLRKKVEGGSMVFKF